VGGLCLSRADARAAEVAPTIAELQAKITMLGIDRGPEASDPLSDHSGNAT
jgi:hypothetical protein